VPQQITRTAHGVWAATIGDSQPVPRFVVLRHNSPRGEHYDFMLEADGVLKTWVLPDPPLDGVDIVCDALPDHRIEYLDYEGPVSGQRGDVARWDAGAYSPESRGDGGWAVELKGEKLAGRAEFVRSADNPEQWRFSYAAASTASPAP
jgi:hypothetical protein